MKAKITRMIHKAHPSLCMVQGKVGSLSFTAGMTNPERPFATTWTAHASRRLTSKEVLAIDAACIDKYAASEIAQRGRVTRV